MKTLKLRSPLRNLSVYGSKGLIVIYGYDVVSGMYHVLEISRPVLATDGNIKVKQFPQEFTKSQIDARKAKMKQAYKDMELLQSNVACIYGCVKLIDSFYLVLVTKIAKCGSLSGHSIYTVDETVSIPVTFGMRSNPDETRYKNILAGFDLTKNIYFSYSYDLTSSWQVNAALNIKNEEGELVDRVTCQSMFVWNSFALKPLLSCADSSAGSMDKWCIPMVYGYVQQRNMKLGQGVSVKFLLIARRSRHFAGTRYLRRGVDSLGHVANEVETEQIFVRNLPIPGDVPRVTSVVQCRGSIPLFWSHTNLFSPKPDVQLESDEVVRQKAAQRHFENLFLRYGYNVNILNLVKQANSKGELMLGTAFGESCQALNRVFQSVGVAGVGGEEEEEESETATLRPNPRQSTSTPPLRFIPYDFLNMAKMQHIAEKEGIANNPEVPNVFRDLNKICERIFPSIGFYVDPPHSPLLQESFRSSKSSVSTQLAAEPESFRFPIDSVYRGVSALGFDCGDLEVLMREPRVDDDKLLLGEVSGVTGEGSPVELRQNGVLRSNCMDCLDRTNVAQFCFARVAIPRQLRSLGVNLTSSGLQEVISLCMEVWAEHGDTMAIQYGGSGAMHKVDEQESSGTGEKSFVLTGGAKNAVVAVKRYYSNISTDYERQDSIDLLLGIFEPKKNAPAIWEQRARTEHLREGVRGRRVSDMTEAASRNERLAEELKALRSASQQVETNQVISEATDSEPDADAEAKEDSACEEGSDRMMSSDSDRANSLNNIAGYSVIGATGSHFHETFNTIDLINFHDIVEDVNVDNVKMDQISVYPFPLSSGLSFRRRLRREQGGGVGEGANPPQTAVSIPPSAIEQLYESYITGDFMFSTSVINYDSLLKSHIGGSNQGEVNRDAGSIKQLVDTTKCSREEREEPGDFIESIASADGATLERLRVLSSLTDRRSMESMESDAEGHAPAQVDSAESAAAPQSREKPIPDRKMPVQKTRSFLWPFRTSNVAENDSEMDRSSAVDVSVSQAESKDSNRRRNGEQDMEYVIRKLDDVSRKIDDLSGPKH